MSDIADKMRQLHGAREALTEIETAPHNGRLCWADWVLAELWVRGLKVVPLEDGDK